VGVCESMITDRTIIDSINKRLLENYRVLDGRPIYRIVWSDDQLEKRFSNKWTDWCGPIIIRSEYSATRTIKKYWYINPPCWVMEKLIFLPSSWHVKELVKELVEAQNGTYEPIYPFRDSRNNPLPVVSDVVDFILERLHNPTKKSPKDLERIREIEEEEEVKYFENELHEGERSPLFVWDNSAFVSTNQLKYRQEYKEKLDAVL
jgi:hypothetical protein